MGSGASKDNRESNWLTGQMLVAMPSMMDPRFARTVTLLCSHTPEGAMGIVLNRLYGDLDFEGLLKQLNITRASGGRDMPIHFGGPVDLARGFVLHSTDYKQEGTLPITDTIALTATVEVLKELAAGAGPHRALLALGYAGWGAGQLDAELQMTGWLVAPADDEIIFDTPSEDVWGRALTKIGVGATALSSDIGHA
jgi:putative transcriptional regulator